MSKSAHARGYDKKWQRLRLVILRERPMCEVCKELPSSHIDHIIRIAAGGARLDRRNLKAMCRFCHGIKTVREDGGYGRPKREVEATAVDDLEGFTETERAAIGRAFGFLEGRLWRVLRRAEKRVSLTVRGNPCGEDNDVQRVNALASQWELAARIHETAGSREAGANYVVCYRSMPLEAEPEENPLVAAFRMARRPSPSPSPRKSPRKSPVERLLAVLPSDGSWIAKTRVRQVLKMNGSMLNRTIRAAGGRVESGQPDFQQWGCLQLCLRLRGK